MKLQMLIPVFTLAVSFSACGHYYSYNDGGYRYTSHQPVTQPYVSSGHQQTQTSGESVGIVHSYVSALDEAKADMATEKVVSAESEELYTDSFSPWVKAESGLGEGYVFSTGSHRKRFEDALETTPQGGEVRWQAGSQAVLFKPNSAIYQPYYSGGRCRDAVVMVTGGVQQHKTRGLFCQRAPGASWVMVSKLGSAF